MAAELTLELAITYVAMIVMAIVPIYIGARRSLLQKQVETMTSKDAWMFPFIASGFLFGLYLLFKFISKDYLNVLLKSYFILFGIFSVAGTVQPVLKKLFPKLEVKNARSGKFRIPIIMSDPVDYKLHPLWIISTGIGIAVSAWYILTGHWIANNILGLAFSIQGIAFISLGSYKTGCLLLSLLFFYDIFWVFGTEVMVSVAKNFDAPIKLLFPRNVLATSGAFEFAMLGLGDIVIPGVFVALLLRYDAKRANYAAQFDTPFFTFAYFGYITGLATTMWVMHTFQVPQPALLYLVPACIGASVLAGVLMGEASELFSYSEEVRQPQANGKAPHVNGEAEPVESEKKGLRKQKKIQKERSAVTSGPRAELEALAAVADSLRVVSRTVTISEPKKKKSDGNGKNKRKKQEQQKKEKSKAKAATAAPAAASSKQKQAKPAKQTKVKAK